MDSALRYIYTFWWHSRSFAVGVVSVIYSPLNLIWNVCLLNWRIYSEIIRLSCPSDVSTIWEDADIFSHSNGNIFRVTGHLCGEFTGDKGQWRGALMLSLICARINQWVNNGEAGDLTRRRAHCDVIVMLRSPLLSVILYKKRSLYSNISSHTDNGYVGMDVSLNFSTLHTLIQAGVSVFDQCVEIAVQHTTLKFIVIFSLIHLAFCYSYN